MNRINISQDKLVELSILNVSCFIIWHLGLWTNNSILQYVCFGGLVISLLVNLFFFYQMRRYTEENKIQLYKQLVNQLVFCICFILFFLVDVFYK